MENEDLESELRKPITLRIMLPPSIQEKLDQHLQVLKLIKHPEKKPQHWIMNAIRKKLIDDYNSLEKGKTINVRLPKKLTEQVNDRIAYLNTLQPNYTKKQWFLEAIEEKLEIEKRMVESKLEEFRKSLS